MLIVTARNMTDGAVSNYEVTVYVNRTQIASFSTYNHRREDGWPMLLRLIADQGEEVERKATRRRHGRKEN